MHCETQPTSFYFNLFRELFCCSLLNAFHGYLKAAERRGMQCILRIGRKYDSHRITKDIMRKWLVVMRHNRICVLMALLRLFRELSRQIVENHVIWNNDGSFADWTWDSSNVLSALHWTNHNVVLYLRISPFCVCSRSFFVWCERSSSNHSINSIKLFIRIMWDGC